MANSVEIGGNVERSIVIQGKGNFVVGGDLILVQQALPSAQAALPDYAFDRHTQKQALRNVLARASAGIVPLYGESGQGQTLVGEFIFQELKQKRNLRRRVRIRSEEWPRVADIDQRLNELCERVALGWAEQRPVRAAHDPETLVAMLTQHAGQEESQSIIVHHAILVPDRDDVRLIERYLERVWRPVLAQRDLPAMPLLVFELNLTRRSSWERRMLRWLRLGDEGAALAILKLLGGFAQSTGATFALAPELVPLTSRELGELYPRSGAVDPAQIQALVLQVHLATRGDFDAVVRQLFPPGAQ